MVSCSDCDIALAVEDEMDANRTAIEHLKTSTHIERVCKRVKGASSGHGKRSIGVLKARLLAAELEEQFSGTMPLQDGDQSVSSCLLLQAQPTQPQDAAVAIPQENKSTLARLEVAEAAIQQMNSLIANLLAKEELLQTNLTKEVEARTSSVEDLSNLVLDIQAQASTIEETIDSQTNPQQERIRILEQKLKRYRREAKVHRQEVDAAPESSEGDVKIWASTMAQGTDSQNKRFGKIERKIQKMNRMVKGQSETIARLEERELLDDAGASQTVVVDSQAVARRGQSAVRDIQDVDVRQAAASGRRTPVHMRYD